MTRRIGFHWKLQLTVETLTSSFINRHYTSRSER